MSEWHAVLERFALTPRGGWIVLSPDGVPIEPRTYPYGLAAQTAREAWCARVVEPKGYYVAVAGEHIPLAELSERCRILAPPARRRKATR